MLVPPSLIFLAVRNFHHEHAPVLYHLYMKRLSSVSISTWLAVLIWAFAFALYAYTIAPTLTWGFRDYAVDGGELLAAAHTLGVPHPPGYPTYMLLLKFFTIIVPFGDTAFRGNLLSATLAATSAMFLYQIVLRTCSFSIPKGSIVLHHSASLLASLTFATSPLFWSLANVTEVYMLNTFFVGALTLCAMRIIETSKVNQAADRGETRTLAIFGLLTSLGLGNHLTLIAVVLPLAIWIILEIRLRRFLSPSFIIFFTLGLSVYLYLPLSAAQNPPINWGNADTLAGFIWMLTGQPYQEYVLAIPAHMLAERIQNLLVLVFAQFNPFGLFLGIVGSVSMWARSRKFLLTILSSALILIIYSGLYATVDSEVLTIPAFMLTSILVGFGALRIMELCDEQMRNLFLTNKMFIFLGLFNFSQIRGIAFTLGILITFALLPLMSVLKNFDSLNLRGDTAAYDRGKQLMEAAPDGSVLLSQHEREVFSIWYIRFVDQPHRDITPVAVPLLNFPWYRQQLFPESPDTEAANTGDQTSNSIIRIVEDNYGFRNVFFSFFDLFLQKHFDLVDSGTLLKATPK